MGRIAVTGSVAYDTIMVFPGRFSEHILPDKTHLINVSFQVDTMERRHGGTAANVCYSMALLGERPLLCAAVGADDFTAYDDRLTSAGVDTTEALRCEDVGTAAAFITTDLEDNQITAFYSGAMARAAGVDLSSIRDVSDVVVGADAPDAMAVHIEQAAKMDARLTFAPAQQIPSLPDATLHAGLERAWLIVANDYEMEMIRQRTGMTLEQLRARGLVAVTHGGEGSALYNPDGVAVIPAAPVRAVVGPTGAGDAYIAGLLFGLRAGLALEVAGHIAAVAAAFVVESNGPQGHTFTPGAFWMRYQHVTGEAPPPIPSVPA
jgi:adenosine kinase